MYVQVMHIKSQPFSTRYTPSAVYLMIGLDLRPHSYTLDEYIVSHNTLLALQDAKNQVFHLR